MNAKVIFAMALFAAGSAMAVNYEALVKSAETSGDGVAPISSIWQKENAAALSKATAPEAVAACVADGASARALLAKVKTAYETDPVAAYQIAEVTHWVMVDSDAAWYEFWREHRGDERRIWTDALIDTALASRDDYIRLFCLDQLRWCACPCQVERIRPIGDNASAGVRQMVDLVIRGLERR